MLTAAQGIVQGCLGAALSARLDSPFFTMAQSVGVEGAFQRVESIVITVWSAADLAFVVLLLSAIKEGAKRAANGRAAGLITAAGIAAAIGSAVGTVLGWPAGETVWTGREGYMTLLLFLCPVILAAVFDKR